MDATDSSRQGNKTGSIRHWWGQSVRSAGGAGASPGSDGVRINGVRGDGVRINGVRGDGVRGDRSVEHEERRPERYPVAGPSRRPSAPAPSVGAPAPAPQPRGKSIR